MQYIKVTFSVPEELSDILIAELNEINYDSFATEGNQLDAFIAKEFFNENDLTSLAEKYKGIIPVEYTHSDLEDKNWNEEWERNFQPVEVPGKCLIRATFHEAKPEIPYEIIINPKMSFGTGHHETTYMMIENQLSIDHMGKSIMDAGSGTGILAILAEKLGAESVLAFDIEEWAYNNMLENIELNHCKKISVARGSLATVNAKDRYDILLANINKNVLLDEIPLYAEKLDKGGKLILSGFYRFDQEDIESKTLDNQLILEKETYKNDWACLVFSKN